MVNPKPNEFLKKRYVSMTGIKIKFLQNFDSNLVPSILSSSQIDLSNMQQKALQTGILENF